MEKKVIKLEDLKEGMKLRSVKNVCWVDRVNDDEGLMLEEELLDKVSWLIKKESIWEVGFDEDLEEWYVMYEEESNEGWFDLEEVLEKGVFEIV